MHVSGFSNSKSSNSFWHFWLHPTKGNIPFDMAFEICIVWRLGNMNRCNFDFFYFFFLANKYVSGRRDMSFAYIFAAKQSFSCSTFSGFIEFESNELIRYRSKLGHNILDMSMSRKNRENERKSINIISIELMHVIYLNKQKIET